MPDKRSPRSSRSTEDARELERLRHFVVAYRELIERHDRTPARWKYFQTEWMWLYARGMVDGETPDAVKQRRLKDLERSKEARHEEEIEALRDEAVKSGMIACYVKMEMFGGPADGQVIFAQPPLPIRLWVYARSINGREVKPRYQRVPDSDGDMVMFDMPRPGASISVEELVKAFADKKSTRFAFVPRRRR